MQGLSSPLSALIVGMAIIVLTLYSVYSFLNTVNTAYSSLLGKSIYRSCDSLKLLNASLINSTVLRVAIANEGSGSVVDVKEVSIAVVLQDSAGRVYSYALRYCNTLGPGCWTADMIVAGSGLAYSYSEHRSLRPGEVLIATGYLPSALEGIVYGYVTAFTSCSKAERVILIGS